MNVGELVSKRALTYPKGPFLKEEGERSFTNSEFNERVNRMTHALAAWGVGRGERVAVLMANTSEFLEIFFACAKTGAIMVPLNFRLAVPELAFIHQPTLSEPVNVMSFTLSSLMSGSASSLEPSRTDIAPLG